MDFQTIFELYQAWGGNWLDILILIFSGIAFLICLKFGLTTMVSTLGALGLALILAFVGYHPISLLLQSHAQLDMIWLNLLVFIAIFFLINFLIRRLGDYFKETLEDLYLGALDRILGGAIGAGFVILLFGLLFHFLAPIPMISEILTDSYFGQLVLPLVQKNLE